MKYDLFISDYDGTFGIAPNYIPEEHIKAVREYTEKGGIFAVCTGRIFNSISNILKDYKINGIVAACQGSVIKDVQSGNAIFEGGLDLNTASRVVEILRKEKMQVCAEVNDVMYCQERSDMLYYYEKACSITAGKVDNLVDFIMQQKKPIPKVIGIAPPQRVEEIKDKYRETFKNMGVEINSGANYLVEAINPNCAKDFAVRKIAEYYGVPLEKVIAVGDSTNDMGLITGEWHGVCVGDGHEDLKKVADEITVPFDQNPISYLLKKYCL